MNKYVVALTDFVNDYNTNMTIVNAENEIQALYYGYDYLTQDIELRNDITSIEDFKDEVSKRSYSIGVIKI